jgi:hypothetical protein
MKNLILFVTTFAFVFIFSMQLPAQESLLSTGGNGTGSGGSVSFSLGQFAYQTYYEENGSIEQGVQHAFEFNQFYNVVPDTFVVDNQTIISGDLLCFNAQQVLTVAGEGNSVVIQNMGGTDFIAGQSIRFLPGFTALSGSTVHGYITIDNNFCNGYIVQSILEVQPIEKNVDIAESRAINNDLSDQMKINVYPNPNQGKFRIDLINFESRATVSIYNLTGAIFYTSPLEQMQQNEISLTYLRNGIYFVKVCSNNKQFVKKIIVNK